ncbi:hypothetical protein GXW74_09870 [Roseomonas eburnea]|uniref:Uncharacterized protein n=1 Tax=Neoroseomonas eburnea TaxID=1346889 RepID=A0A9X9XAQ8_9PROT|nr:hypothetical protein [Neoroseomonas eburnea]MBR0680794.1 hypothetical protein [Neoroseomonas eburnea]
MRKIVVGVAALAAVGVVAVVATIALRGGGMPATDRGVEAELRQAVEQLRPFPQRIDEATELTDARADGRTMTYVYRLTVSDTFDQAAQRARLEQAACGNPAMRAAIRDHGVAFIYEYRAFADPARIEARFTVDRCG